MHWLAAHMLAQSASSHSYTPFIDPLEIPGFNLQDYWWLTLIPLAFFTSLAYKAVRVGDFKNFWRHVLVMTVQIVIAMIILAIAIYVLIEVIVPRLDP